MNGRYEQISVEADEFEMRQAEQRRSLDVSKSKVEQLKAAQSQLSKERSRLEQRHIEITDKLETARATRNREMRALIEEWEAKVPSEICCGWFGRMLIFFFNVGLVLTRQVLHARTTLETQEATQDRK